MFRSRSTFKNAFNTTFWSEIKQRIREVGRVEENHRKLHRGKRRQPFHNRGVPHGSTVTPTLWNLLYDPVLCLPPPDVCQTYAFADDLTLLLEAPESVKLECKAKVALDDIWERMVRNRLSLAVQKTEAVMMKRSCTKDRHGFDILGTRITLST